MSATVPLLSVQAAQLAAIPPLTTEGATSYQVRSSGSIASGGFTIPNRIGHRRTIIDIFFEPETSGVFLDLTIGDRTYVRLPTVLGDYVAGSNTNKGVGFVKSENNSPRGKGVLRWLSDFVPFDYPTAAQDENIVVTPNIALGYGALPANYVITVHYLDQDTGDVVNKAVAGGTANQRRLYTNMITNGLAQQTAGQTLLDTVITPKGLNGIADNALQIAGLKLTGYMMMYDGSALGTTTGANANGKPLRLHILDVDIELFGVETTEGILLDRDFANEMAFDFLTESMFYIPQPYVFNQNRKFRFQLDTAQKTGTGVNFAANTQFMMIVGIREPATA